MKQRIRDTLQLFLVMRAYVLNVNWLFASFGVLWHANIILLTASSNDMQAHLFISFLYIVWTTYHQQYNILTA